MVAIIGAANCSVAAAAGGAWLITKTGGTPGIDDARALSAAAIAGDFILRARSLAGGLVYVGLGSNPASGSGGAAIERAVQINGTAGRCYDLGIYKPPIFAVPSYVWLRRSGGILEYLTGPVLAGATLRRSVTGITAPLWFDSALASAGAAIEIKFAAPSGFAARARRHGLTFGVAL
jgi:hypothetical protein